MKSNGDNVILNMTFDFALKILSAGDELMLSKRWVVANRLTKAGTSIGANVREAQNAESKLDFIHKFKIAAKEAEETLYCFELCKAAGYIINSNELIEELQQIKKVLNKIIATSKTSSKSLANYSLRRERVLKLAN